MSREEIIQADHVAREARVRYERLTEYRNSLIRATVQRGDWKQADIARALGISRARMAQILYPERERERERERRRLGPRATADSAQYLAENPERRRQP